jgi:hypothetical protein
MTITSSSVRRHASAKYNHRQANIESRFRYIKYAPNGIPLGAHFIYLNLDSTLAWWRLYLAETHLRTKELIIVIYDNIFMFIDWLIYYYIDITQRDGFYQN